MKIIAVLWAVFLIFGCWWIKQHAESEPKPVLSNNFAAGKPCAPAQLTARQDSYPAKHAMIINYRIGDTDLDWSAEPVQNHNRSQFQGKYTACAIRAGDPVSFDVLRAAPVIQPSAGKSPYLLSLKNHSALAELLNAGSRIDLFQDSTPLLREVPILAIQCDPVQRQDCSAVLDLSSKEAERLSKAETQKLHIIVRQVY